MYKLKELRKNKKISQQELADKLNISRESISKYEKGEQEASYATLKKISNFFNVSIDYLLSASDEEIIMITKEDLFKLKEASETIKSITEKITAGINITIGDNNNIQFGNNNRGK